MIDNIIEVFAVLGAIGFIVCVGLLIHEMTKKTND